MNPIKIIDSILEDYASPRTRRTVHRLVVLLSLFVGIWLAAEGNWVEALTALAAMIYAEANRANTPAAPDNGDWERDETVSGNPGNYSH